MAITPELDKYYPPCGPCAFCGHHDKRHRLWDAFIDRNNAGETAEEIAADYEMPLEHIELVLKWRPYQ